MRLCFLFFADALPEGDPGLEEHGRCCCCLDIFGGQKGPAGGKGWNKVPPGHAVIDCGCTASLIGEANVPAWEAALAEKSGGTLTAKTFADSTSFRGIGGVQKSLRGVRWPAQLVGCLGRPWFLVRPLACCQSPRCATWEQQ